MKHEDFDDIIQQGVEIAEEHEQELFGDVQTLPEDEFDIVFSRIKHKDKIAVVKTLRTMKE